MRSVKSLSEILDLLISTAECSFRPATHLPKIEPALILPPDLAEFYSRFSEARLFGPVSDPRYHILPPAEFVRIGLVVYGQQSSNPLQHSWYALAHVQDGNYIAIDCHPSRVGYCYDVFHETADDLSYCQIIALSFTELLNLAAIAGDSAWWLKEDVKGYGYADKLAHE
jgi:hypothetical protein